MSLAECRSHGRGSHEIRCLLQRDLHTEVSGAVSPDQCIGHFTVYAIKIVTVPYPWLQTVHRDLNVGLLHRETGIIHC